MTPASNDTSPSSSGTNTRKRSLGTATEGDHSDEYDQLSHRELKAALSKRHVRGIKRANNTKDAIISWLRQDDATRRTADADSEDVETMTTPLAAACTSETASMRTRSGAKKMPDKVAPSIECLIPTKLTSRVGDHPMVLPNKIHIDDIDYQKWPDAMITSVGGGWYHLEPSYRGGRQVMYVGQRVPYVSRAEFVVAVNRYRSDRDTPTWFTDWLKADKIERGLGFFWWVHGQLALVRENSRPAYSLAASNMDPKALVKSIPKGKKAGFHSIITPEELAISTNSQSILPYVHVGKRTLAWPVEHTTTLPDYMPRRSKNDWRKLAGDDPKLLALIDSTPVADVDEPED